MNKYFMKQIDFFGTINFHEKVFDEAQSFLFGMFSVNKNYELNSTYINLKISKACLTIWKAIYGVDPFMLAFIIAWKSM